MGETLRIYKTLSPAVRLRANSLWASEAAQPGSKPLKRCLAASAGPHFLHGLQEDSLLQGRLDVF